MSDGPALSAPCLFYLFADRVLPREGHWNHAMGDNAVPVPKTNTLVSLGPLEKLLLAVGLWSLERDGVIELSAAPVRGNYSLRRAGPVVERSGLEATLLGGIPDEGSISLSDLIMGLWVQDGPMALNAIVVEVQREAMDAHVIQRPELPHLIPGLFGHHTFPRVIVDGPALYRQRRPFVTVSAGWSQARASSPRWDDLVRRLGRVLFFTRPTYKGMIYLQPGRP